MNSLFKKVHKQFLEEFQIRHLKHLSNTTFAAVATMVLGLLTNVIWTRFFEEEVFGSFKLFISTVNFIAAFSFMGISSAIMISCSENCHGNFAILLKRKIYINILLALIGLFAASVYLEKLPLVGFEKKLLVIIFVLFPLFNLTDIWTSWLNGKSSFFALAKNRIIRSALSTCIIGSFALVHSDDIFWIIGTYLVVLGIQNLIHIRSLMEERTNSKVNQNTISYGNHTSAALIFSSLMSIEVFLLAHYGSLREIVYSLSHDLSRAL